MSQRVVGDVAVRVGADVGPLKIGLQDGARSVDRFGNKANRRGAQITKALRSVAVVGAAMGTALVAASRQAISALDSVGKKAAQIGTSAEELQRFAFAAKSAGVESASLNSSLERFVKRLGEAEAGFGAAKKTLEQLGLSAAELAAMPLPDAVGIVADELSKMSSASEQAAVAAALFGREGVAMINMLRDGGDALRDTMNAADEFGAVVSNETVAAAEALEDRMGRLGDGIKGQLNAALVEMGPLLVSAAELALQLARAFNGLVTFIGDTYGAIEQLLNPMARLAAAHDEVVDAMADEIMQSKQLEAVLEQGGAMSVEMARVKLQEAKARRENAAAAVAESQAINSGRMEQVRAEVMDRQDALRSMVPPGSDEGQIPFDMRETYEAENQGLALALQRMMDLQEADARLNEHLERTQKNVAALTEGIANAVNGVVGGSSVEPIDPRDREGGGGGGGGGGGSKPEAKDASFIDQLLGLDDASQEATAERMEGALEKQQEFMARAQEALIAAREQGLITQEQFNEAEQKLQEQHNAEMKQLRMQQAADALGAASTMFDGLAQIAQSGGEQLLGISKAFAAAQALVSTLQGAAKELEKGTFGFATAAMVIAKGASFIAAIRGIGSGGGGASVGAVGASSFGGPTNAGSIAEREEQVGQSRTLTLIGERFNRKQAEEIARFMNDGTDDGLVIRGRA